MTVLRPVAVPAVPAGPSRVRALPATPEAPTETLTEALADALAGGPAVLPYAAAAGPPPLPRDAVPDAGTALVVGTSGSTGAPKLAMLTAAALQASAAATHDRLGGAGQWLLALPAHHIAGLQVLLRCLAAGTEPVAADLTGGFTPAAFVAAAGALRAPRRYTSLVPTQLLRLLQDPAGTEALRSLDAVLVGGAGTPGPLLERAAAAGVTVVPTYGMSETAGGCVYAGRPLDCSAVEADADGRLLLGGATLALGYLGRPDLSALAFRTAADGRRWFHTDDVGHRGPDGRWHVDGRVDDVIVTGGLKVAPRPVEEAVLAALPQVRECAVVGVPDPQWGQAVAAAVVLRPGGRAPTVADLRAALRGAVPDHALPRRVAALPALPVRGPGKPDRRAVAAALAASA